MGHGTIRAGAAAIGAAVLLLGIAGCTGSGGGKGSEAKAVDPRTVVPSLESLS